jgi:patatin-like phospholipase/acyl hydrolase
MTDTETSKRFQVLSLDGGGLKGIFTASFLAGWESAQGRSVNTHFDLIAGTSTGGIIALGLGLGLSASEILKFYLDEAENIFPRRAFAEARHWLAVKHDAAGLETALAKYFGDRRLGDCTKPLLIPAYYPKLGDVYIFKTPHHRRLQNDFRELVRDVARATSAAPTYFDPFNGESGVELVDGGVWANNPVMLAVTEALGYFGKLPAQVAALRVGTTTEVVATRSLPESGGKLPMAKAVLDFMMRGQERSASNMALHVLSKHRYHEVNVTTAPGDFALDKLSEELVGFGRAAYRTHSSELDEKGFFAHTADPYTPCYKT